VRRTALTKMVNQLDLLVSATLILCLTLLALLGFSLASQALPFVMAAFAGFVVGFVAITDDFPDWLQGAAGILTVVALIVWGLMLVGYFWEAGWTGRLQVWDKGLGGYTYAYALGCVLVLVRKFLFPYLFPNDAEDAVVQGRNLRRGVFVIGGLLAGLFAVATLIYSFLLLVSYLAIRLG